MKKLVIFSLAISVITLTGFWSGSKLCVSMQSGRLNPDVSWYDSLKLEPPQLKALKKSDQEFTQKADRICMAVCKTRFELLRLMRQDGVDAQVIHEKIDAITQLQNTLEKEIMDHVLAVKVNLSSDQRKRYFDHVDKEFNKTLQQCGYPLMTDRETT